MIVANSLTALMYLFGSDTLKESLPTAPSWTFPVLAVLCVFNLICSIALFKWQKWGFWGFLATSVVALFVNFALGIGIAQSLLGLLGVALLYAVLQIGKENKGWPQLE